MNQEAEEHNGLALKMIAGLLAILLAMGSGPLSAAGSRRGATVRVTLQNGRVIEGELLAVKERSLVVHDSDACQGYIIEIEQAARVRLVKKSKLLLGGFYGTLAGLGVATLFNTVLKPKDSEGWEVLGFFIFPPLFSIPGAIMGAAAGLDEEWIPGRETAEGQTRGLGRLSRLARNRSGSVEGLSFPVTSQLPPELGKKIGRSITLSSLRRERRFRLLWSGNWRASSGQLRFSPETGSFRFLDEVPSGNSTSYSIKLEGSVFSASSPGLGRFRLDYALTPQFFTGVEFVSLGTSNIMIDADFLYYSSEKQREFESFEYIDHSSSASGCLVGLGWRSSPVSFARRDIFELSAAVGPAWVHTQIEAPWRMELISKSEFSTSAWTWRVQAAYDHFYNDAFSLGCFVEYLSLAADFPPIAFKGEEEFWPVDNYQVDRFTEKVEFTIPSYRCDFGGLSYGVRASLRF